jgi:ABC-type antimicrobial peptide transport system permease subunit
VLTALARSGGLIVTAGIVSGIIGALAANRLLAAFIGGISPHDPITMVVVALLLVLVASVAIVIPARRAMRIDPIATLRHD